MYNKLLSLSIATGILIPNMVLAEQTVIQRGRTSATAIGNNNRAQSTANQSTTQSQNSSNYLSGNRQTSIQQGESNSTGIGNDNLITNRVYQNSTQTQTGNYRDRSNQNSEQNATSRGEAAGDRNRVNNTTRQYNRQNRWSY